MSVTVCALVTINEDNPMALAEYLAATAPLLKEAGAKIVRRFNLSALQVGEAPPQTLIMVEFPDRAAVDQVIRSEAYRAISAERGRAFSSHRLSIVTNDTSDAESRGQGAD